MTNDVAYLNQEFQYNPFGSTRVSQLYGGLNQRNQYIGQDLDQETSLSYLNARYYDGERGRFLGQDPVFNEVGITKDGRAVLRNPQAQNSYSYGQNNPLVNKDPSGRIALAATPLALAAGPIGWPIVGASAAIIAGIWLISKIDEYDFPDPETLQTGTVQESNPYATMGFPPPRGPDDLQMPPGDAPKWKKAVAVITGIIVGGKDIYDRVESITRTVESTRPQQPKNSSENLYSDPRSSNVQEARGYYNQARDALNRGDLTAAKKYADKANSTLNKK